MNDLYHAEALAMLASIEEEFALLRDCVHFKKMEFMLLEAELAANGEFILTYTTYHVKLLTLTYNG